MLQSLVALLEAAITSPWAYLAIFAVATVDAFFPVIPGESLVITAGVFAAAVGEPDLVLVVAVAALGAFLGDHISYALGRSARGPVRRRGGAAYAWAGRAPAERGGLVLVVARYVPGGRTAVTVSAGAVGYPLRRFTPFAALAAATWGSYSALVGYLGGRVFDHDPLKGLLAGLGFALAITVVVEIVRYTRRRRHLTESAGVYPCAARQQEAVSPGPLPPSGSS